MQSTDVLNELLMLKMAITFIAGNLKGLSDERNNSIKTPNHSSTPNLDYYGTQTRVEFNGSCFKQDKVTFNHGKVENIYIVYETSESINISDYPTL